ncbi:hypothetical protein GQ57_38310 [Burkholderia sp. MSh2]|nr:hypothetical protein GQ57_38310 [Burkholderia sp. MSh2]KFG98660.1 hypothetical protein GQ56_0103905 [Burkholderia paludis]
MKTDEMFMTAGAAAAAGRDRFAPAAVLPVVPVSSRHASRAVRIARPPGRLRVTPEIRLPA